MNLFETIATVVWAFITTNIDDLFLLLAFFTQVDPPRFRKRHIMAGQYWGMAALTFSAMLFALVGWEMLGNAYLGLLGFVPILLGVKKLWDLRLPDADDDESKPLAEERSILWGLFSLQTLHVAAVVVANGSDNLGVYVPLFATFSYIQLLDTVFVFAVLVLAWIAVAEWLVSHRLLADRLRRYSRWAFPIVLIVLGLFVLYESGSWSLVAG